MIHTQGSLSEDPGFKNGNMTMAIILQTVSDSKQAQADLAKLRQSVEGIQTSTGKVSRNLIRLGSATIAFGSIAAAARGYTNMSDTLTNLENRIRTVTTTQKEFNGAFSQIRQIAIGTRSDLDSIAKLYTKISLNSKEMGASQGQVAALTSAVAKSLAISGASAEEAKSSIQQFAQAMASGKLAGDEFRTVLENAPSLANSIAKGLHVSLGEMYKLRDEGKLLASSVFGAILNQQDAINEKFGKLRVTYSSAFTNLGNSLLLLFGAVKSNLFNSSSSFAAMINDWAVSIADFATYFKFYMLKAKSQLVLFVISGIVLFEDLWDTVKTAGERAFTGLIDIIGEFNPAIKASIMSVLGFAKAVGSTFTVLFDRIRNDIMSFGLVKVLTAYLKTAITAMGSVLNRLGDIIRPIDVRRFFPGLDGVLAYIGSWAQRVERWFFWLYDQVIGHSWIPDLVEGVISWLSKLMGTPLGIVKNFSGKVSEQFEGLGKLFGKDRFKGISLLFGAGASFVGVFKLQNNLAKILSLVTGIVTAWQGMIRVNADLADLSTAISRMGARKTNNALSSARDSVVSKLPGVMQPYVPEIKPIQAVPGEETPKGVAKRMEYKFETTTLIRMLKQVFGVKDTNPGKLFGREIATDGYVGLGPQRYEKHRVPMHDAINALPLNAQLPTITAITAVMGAGIVAAFKSGPVRSSLLFMLTTGWGIVSAKALDHATIKRQFFDLGAFMLKGIKYGLDSLFNGNVAKDPFGFLALIAKIALLFKVGREFFGKIAVGTATSPLKNTLTVNDIFDAKVLKHSVSKLEDRLRELPDFKVLDKNLNEATAEYKDSVKRLASQIDTTGKVVGKTGATNLLNGGLAGKRIGLDTDQEAILAKARLDRDRFNLSRAAFNDRAGLEDRKKSQTTQRDKLVARVEEHKTAIKEGVVNYAAGAGAIVGSAAGFQIGQEIAKGMEGSPSWQRIAVTMLGAMTGQAVGSTFGLVASQFILAGLRGGAGLISKAIVGPLVSAAAAIVTSMVAAFGIIPVAIFAAVVALGATIFLFRDKIMAIRWDEIGRTIGNAFANAAKPGAWGHDAAIGFMNLLDKKILPTLGGWFGMGSLFGTPEPEKVKMTGLRGSGSTPMVIQDILHYGLTGQGAGPVIPKTDPRAKPKPKPDPVVDDPFSMRAIIDRVKGVIPAPAMNALTGFLSGGLNPPKMPNAGNLGGSGMPPMGAMAGDISDAANNVYKSALENGATAAASFEVIAKGISKFSDDVSDRLAANDNISTKAGDKQVSAALSGADIASIPAKTTSKIAEALDNIAKFEGLAKRHPGSASSSIARETANEWKSVLAELVDGAKFTSGKVTAEGLIETATDPKKARAKRAKQGETLGDEFDLVNSMLPDLQLTKLEFNKFSDSLREDLIEMASGLKSANDTIEKLPLGTKGAAKLRSAFLKKQKEDTSSAEIKLKDSRTPFAQLKFAIEKSGINLSEDLYNAMEDAQAAVIRDGTSAVIALKDKLQEPGIPDSVRVATNLALKQRLEEVERFVNDIADNFGKNRLQKLSKGLESVGLSADLTTLSRFSDDAIAKIEAYKDKLKDIDLQLNDSKMDLSGDARKSLLTKRDSLVENFDFDTAVMNRGEMAKTAGKALSSAIHDTLNSALSDFIKGKTSFKDMLKSILDNITSQIIDTMVQGFTEPLTGESGILTKGIRKLGASIFKDVGLDSGVSVADKISDGAKAVKSSNLVKGMFSEASVGSELADKKESGFFGGIKHGVSKFFGGSNTSSTPSVDTGEQSSGIFGGIGKGIGKLFGASAPIVEGIGDVTAPITDVAKVATNALPDVATSMAKSSEGIVKGLGGLFKGGAGGGTGGGTGSNAGLWGLAGGLFGKLIGGMFANGGLLKGPGTGRSDSMLIGASTGEFITNAASTKKNLPLLKAINDNKFNFQKFADGGLVNSKTAALANSQFVPVPVVSRGSLKTSQIDRSPNSTVVNLQVVGDVSRQTRAEIVKMIPNLAEGVNAHNREKGYRG